MKKPLYVLVLIPLGLWATFALPGVVAEAKGFWDWRQALIVLSGVLALWWMSAGMVLATRPVWLERRFGGLDKLYRLHKNIGIGAGILVLAHWLAEWLPKNLGKLGLFDRPSHPHGHGAESLWLGLAKDVGEWAGYILMALVVLALVKRIPYRYFRWVHRAFAPVFLAGAFHGLMLMPTDFWRQPLGWFTAAMAVIGVVPALLSLAGRIGADRRHPARIEALRPLPDGVLEVVLRPIGRWPGHRAGQFLFVDFGHAGEGAHPFTIASAWAVADGTLTIAIKALGDYTRSLPGRLAVGNAATLEGPYGDFTFDTGTAGRQVWVAGGIGITPFLARLRELAAGGRRPSQADLFYCTRGSLGAEIEAELATLCRDAGVCLHRRLTDDQGPLDSAEVEARLAPEASVWFCGPAAWGKALADALARKGLPAKAFHREAFEFR